MPAVFHLAPMTRDLRVATWVLLGLPAVFVAGALAAPFPVSTILSS
jgi:hypothetical protein